MDNVLLHGEAEGYVKTLEKMPLKDIGSTRWFRQHEFIEKLNMQAILNASANQEEYVQELFVSSGKIPVLVHEMILIEVWKQKIFSILCQLQDFTPKTTFPLYMVIHHEATVINLLETIMFHQDSCESAEEAVLDLVDYCHRKLTLLVGKCARGDAPTGDSITHPPDAEQNSVQELQNQSARLEFDIALKALSVLRYITGHVESLSVSVLSRLLRTHNMPCVLVQLVEHCPWKRYTGGKVEKYSEGEWHTLAAREHQTMTQQDGQLWIALLNLLLKPQCQGKYDYNNFNKNQLLKLRGFLTEVLIDQLPVLGELQRFLSQLALTDPAPPKKDLILEQIPEMWSGIMEANEGKWKAIAKHQIKTAFNPSDSDLREQAQRLSQTYNLDVLESLIQGKPKCGLCGAEATKRCSRCQGEWYCNRECQVKHWPKHKPACQLMSDATEKLQTELNISE
ncbi:zinc finger MYND domain-containing protein 10 [Engraulis encrasicolus]|uniref:zinc finger MYND domain-containing protein 10 n=1 Tax=Engraulis encrasicolus TaxID=184585 RepID=UPI002FD15756